MADRRNGASPSWLSSAASIHRLPLDPLTSILLRLPVDSILSFGMTCRRFRSLTGGGAALWESICRRDWGASYVDALIISYHDNNKVQVQGHHHPSSIIPIPWKKLYRHLRQLDSVQCRNLLPDNAAEVGPSPSPRASHSLHFVSGFLFLFGGGCEGGRVLDDTWVAHVGDDLKKILKWKKISSGIPSGRFGHSSVVIGDSIVLFGGINDRGVRKNDTWVGQLVSHQAFGVTWRLLDVGSVAPLPRGAHAGCCIDKKKMLIFGGIGPSGDRLGDTWVLHLSENLCRGTWQEVVARPSPPSRSGHTLTQIGGTQTILFGGRGLHYDVLNDVWLFEAYEEGGRWRWVQLVFQLQSIPQELPLPRVGHSATLILGGQLLIYGGEDSSRHRKDDLWALDVNSISRVNMQPIALTKMWKRWKALGDEPMCRSFHGACADNSGRYLYVFGGMVDGLLQPAETLGWRFDSDLFLVELVL